jgi:hypothetical protein
MFNSESWWRNSIKYGHKMKNKALRKMSKMLLRKEKWDSIPKKLHIVPDDGT